MPELPEVEVVKKSLNKKIQNLIIKNVKIIDKNLRYKVNKEEISKIIGRKIIKIERRSKFLIFKMEKKMVMLFHLGMTGKFFFINKKNKKYKTSFYYSLNDNKDKKHDRIIFSFQKNQKLIYNDIRKFGFVKFYLLDDLYNSSHFKNLGPEPLENRFNTNYFKAYINRRNRTIKDILMDQKCVSGLGNIYVNEILFLSGINPTRKVKQIKNFEIVKMIKNIKKILKNSIKLGGSSIKDFYSGDGKKGTFQQYFKIYGRQGEKCSNTDCNENVKRIVISNRSSFFCKRCQK